MGVVIPDPGIIADIPAFLRYCECRYAAHLILYLPPVIHSVSEEIRVAVQDSILIAVQRHSGAYKIRSILIQIYTLSEAEVTRDFGLLSRIIPVLICNPIRNPPSRCDGVSTHTDKTFVNSRRCNLKLTADKIAFLHFSRHRGKPLKFAAVSGKG